MKDNYKAIADALTEAGFKTSLESAEGMPLDFKLTPYSLNSKMSFRFENLEDFDDFLKQTGHNPDITKVNASIIELGLNPNEFFYVNFFQKGKEEEEM